MDHSWLLEDGTRYLAKALEIDPQNDDATTYRNLFIKESAGTPEEYRADVEAAAIRWVQRAVRAKVATENDRQTPQRVSVTGDVQQNNLILKVRPVYPQAAKARRIQGTVRFSAIIGKDGRVQNLSLISGHPLLLESARQAVIQWEYKPAFYNGEPVEVVTWIDVNFSIGESFTPGTPRICNRHRVPSASAAAASDRLRYSAAGAQ